MSDDVRQAARDDVNMRAFGLFGAWEKTSEAKILLSKPLFVMEAFCAGYRAALASGERGEYERGVEDAAKVCEAFARKHGGVFEDDGTVSRGPMFVAATNCAAAIRSLAAPAENDAGRGEARPTHVRIIDCAGLPQSHGEIVKVLGWDDEGQPIIAGRLGIEFSLPRKSWEPCGTGGLS